MGILRQILKPLYYYWKDPDYRAYLRVQQSCRNQKGKPVTIWLDGYVIEGNEGPSLLHQYEEIIQRRSFDFVSKNNSPVIICCGANIGLEILHLEQMYPDARIKAYEADPVLYSVLKSNIERNESKAEAVNCAIHTQNGTVKFTPDGKLGGKIGAGTLEVKSVRLRDILAAEHHIDLLIMDVEGCETDVLRDCADQLTKVDSIFVEWHSDENSPQTLSELLNILQTAGFRYRLNNNLGSAPFMNPVVENGFDAMVEIYASRVHKS